VFICCLMFMVSYSACSTKMAKVETKSKEDYAKEIIELTDVNKILDQVMAQIKQMQGQMMAQAGIPESEKERAMALQDKVQVKMAEAFDMKKIEPQFIDIFTSVYTVEELKAMSDFYKTPEGKSMIEKQPQVLQKSMQVAQNIVQGLLPELQKIIAEAKKK
ncbi:MAG: DUF2059 domain-containing protein, partial [Methanosarcina sp.]|nr:DUF2059 domain-containing protein [Methanosarcina sp.]